MNATLIVIEETPDWEERYRLLFERQELFMQKLCKSLHLEWQVTSENDVLKELEKVTENKNGNGQKVLLNKKSSVR